METIYEAYQLIENHQPEKALKLLEQYYDKANDDEKFTIAQIYIELGDLLKASSIIEELLQKYPDENELKITLSDIYIELEQDEIAMNLLMEIKEDDPYYIEALVQLADLYQAQGLFEVAEQKLKEAKNREPNEEIIDFALGELYFSIGEYKHAIMYYENIFPKEEKIANVSLGDRLGEAYAAIGEYEKALTYFKDDKEDPDRLFRYGMTAYQADRNDIATKAWEHVLDLDQYYHTAYYFLAKAYEADGRIEEAYNIAKKGLQIDEFNKELYFLTGTLAHKIGDNTESENFIKKAIALDADYKQAVLFLVQFYKEEDNYEAIVKLINEIKSSGADDPLYDWEIARAYVELELYDDALIYYQEAYNNLNQDSEFVKEYGYYLTEEGRMKEAVSVFEHYLTLEPLDGEVEEFLARLKQSGEDV